MYVPDQNRTQEMCDNVILENDRILRFIPNCYSNQKIYNKSVNTNLSAIQVFSECFKLKNMW